MLILTRAQREKILIGDNIVITIAQIKGGRVRVGIEAPAEVKVLRGEVAQRIEQQPKPVMPPIPAFQPPQIMGFARAA